MGKVVQAVAMGALVAASTAHGLVVNGGFETGDLAGWEVFAPNCASVVDSTFGSTPPEGNYGVLLQTPTKGWPNIMGLTSFVDVGYLDLLFMGNGIPVEGAAIKQTFYASAGQTLSIDYNFYTNAPTPRCLPLGLDNDFAFISLNGLSELADARGADALSATHFDYETGFSTFNYTFTSDGWYTLCIGIVDVGPANLFGRWDDSGLFIDNIRLSELSDPGQIVVPEPATAALIVAGLGSMAATLLRGQRRRAD